MSDALHATSQPRLVAIVESREDWTRLEATAVDLAERLKLQLVVWVVASELDVAKPAGTSQSLPAWAIGLTRTTSDVDHLSSIAEVDFISRDTKTALSKIHRAATIHSVLLNRRDENQSELLRSIFQRSMVRCIWMRPPKKWNQTIAVEYENAPSSSGRLVTQLRTDAGADALDRVESQRIEPDDAGSGENARQRSHSVPLHTAMRFSSIHLRWKIDSQPSSDDSSLPKVISLGQDQQLLLQFADGEHEPTELTDALILFPVRETSRSSLPYSSAKLLAGRWPDCGFAIVKEPWSSWKSLVGRFELLVDTYFPQMKREERKKLSGDLDAFSSLNGEFLLLVSASAFLAAFGLIMNSASVIIGAMLIAPLMTPIQGMGLSLTNGSRELFHRAAKTVAIGFLFALLSGAVMGVWLRLTTWDIELYNGYMTDEMWARCRPSLLDLAVGFVGGSAAAFARTRSHLADALAGAAIAAALVPPIATAGLQIAMWPISDVQEHTLPIVGPMLVFFANVLTITIGTSMILWLRGIRGFHEHGSRDRWSNRMIMLLTILAVLLAMVVVQIARVV
jgi:uncharacterized hydrophobic protein (TIGR00271 family)